MPEYEQVVKTFKLPTGVNRIQVRLTVDDSGSIIYFDDVSLVPLFEYSTGYSSILEPLASGYGLGRWGINPSGSVELYGDTYSVHIISGVHINPQEGSIYLRWCPVFSGNLYDSNATLINISGYDGTNRQNIARILYRGNEQRFSAEIWDNSGLKWNSFNSDWDETFPSGTWIDICLTYNATYGAFLYLSGTLAGVYDSSWTPATLPYSMDIGGNSGTGIEPALGRIDTVETFRTVLTSDLVALKYLENYGND